MNELESEILGIKGVSKGKSRYADQTAFFAGEKEIAHLHNDHEIDIRLTAKHIREYRKRLSTDPDNQIRAQWTSVQFYSDEDIEFVVELMALAAEANR